MSSRPVYRICAQVAPSAGECLRGKATLDRMLANLGVVCFWQPYIPSGLNLVVAAVLRDSLCVVSLLPCVADCCMLYTVCWAVERFVLTIIKRRLLLLITAKYFTPHSQPYYGCEVVAKIRNNLRLGVTGLAVGLVVGPVNENQLYTFSGVHVILTFETMFKIVQAFKRDD